MSTVRGWNICRTVARFTGAPAWTASRIVGGALRQHHFETKRDAMQWARQQKAPTVA